MWYEARRQEKKLRTIMVDHKKRADRRRMFYEKIKKDPAEFMQLHGRYYKIHLDPLIASAAENQSILRPWQGDSNVLIDRFDVRSHLDFIPEPSKEASCESGPSDDWTDRRCFYERYRILVLNDFEKVPEDKFLKQIYMEENFGQDFTSAHALAKAEEEKKKKLAKQKAAIGFSYADIETGDSSGTATTSSAWPQRSNENEESSSDSEESMESDYEPDFDKRLDVSDLNPEQCKELNTIGTKYGLKANDFVKCLWEDYEEQAKLQNLKEAEDEKVAMAGKQSRRERKLLKEIRIRDRGMVSSPLSVLRIPAEPGDNSDSADERWSSSSRSSSHHRRRAETIQFITSFGDDRGSDGEETGGTAATAEQGPALPLNDKRKRLQSAFA